MNQARVLVVGSKAGEALATCGLHLDSGFVLDRVDDSSDALPRLKGAPYEIMICDIAQVVEGNLVEVARGHFPGLCIIATASHAPVDQVIAGMRRGMFDCLLEPISPATLMAALRRGLESRRLFIEYTTLVKEHRERLIEIEEQRRQLEKEHEELKVINEVARAMTSTLNVEEILGVLLRGIHRLLQFDRVLLSLVNKEKGLEEAKLSIGSDDGRFRRQVWRLDDPGNPWMPAILDEKRSILVDPIADPAYASAPVRALFPAPFVKVPIVVKGSVIGTITADNSICGRAPTESDVHRMELFVEHVGIALENARLYYDIIESKEQVLITQKQLVEAERLAALGAMAASINHEINNPLCAIMLDVQLLQLTLGEGEAKARSRVASIENSVNRIRAVTEKVAALKRTIVTEYQPKTTMLDLNLSTE